jgi:hypothetical protein
MLVVDLMHEFELGVWRTLLTHLLRVLYAASGPSAALIDTFNRRHEFAPDGHLHVANLRTRFRLVPTFGTHTIRRFKDNVSELKKLAARDYEDILQVRGSNPL